MGQKKDNRKPEPTKDYTFGDLKKMFDALMKQAPDGSMPNSVFGKPLDPSQYDGLAAAAEQARAGFASKLIGMMQGDTTESRIRSFTASFGKKPDSLLGKTINKAFEFDPNMAMNVIGHHGGLEAASFMLNMGGSIARARGLSSGGVLDPYRLRDSTMFAASQGGLAYQNNFNKIDGTIDLDQTHGLNLNQAAFIAGRVLSDRSNYKDWADRKMPGARAEKDIDRKDSRFADELSKEDLQGLRDGTKTTKRAQLSFNKYIKDFTGEINGFVSSISKMTGDFESAVRFMQEATGGKAFSAGKDASSARKRAATMATNIRMLAADAGISAQEAAQFIPTTANTFKAASGASSSEMKYGDKAASTPIGMVAAAAIAKWKKDNPGASQLEVDKAAQSITERAIGFGKGDMRDLNVIAGSLVDRNMATLDEVKSLSASGDAYKMYRFLEKKLGGADNVNALRRNRNEMSRMESAHGTTIGELHQLSFSKGISDEQMLYGTRNRVDASKKQLIALMTGINPENAEAIRKEVNSTHVNAMLNASVLAKAGISDPETVKAIQRDAKRNHWGLDQIRDAVRSRNGDVMELDKAAALRFTRDIKNKTPGLSNDLSRERDYLLSDEFMRSAGASDETQIKELQKTAKEKGLKIGAIETGIKRLSGVTSEKFAAARSEASFSAISGRQAVSDLAESSRREAMLSDEALRSVGIEGEQTVAAFRAKAKEGNWSADKIRSEIERTTAGDMSLFDSTVSYKSRKALESAGFNGTVERIDPTSREAGRRELESMRLAAALDTSVLSGAGLSSEAYAKIREDAKTGNMTFDQVKAAVIGAKGSESAFDRGVNEKLAQNIMYKGGNWDSKFVDKMQATMAADMSTLERTGIARDTAEEIQGDVLSGKLDLNGVIKKIESAGGDTSELKKRVHFGDAMGFLRSEATLSKQTIASAARQAGVKVTDGQIAAFQEKARSEGWNQDTILENIGKSVADGGLGINSTSMLSAAKDTSFHMMQSAHNGESQKIINDFEKSIGAVYGTDDTISEKRAETNMVLRDERNKLDSLKRRYIKGDKNEKGKAMKALSEATKGAITGNSALAITSEDYLEYVFKQAVPKKNGREADITNDQRENYVKTAITAFRTALQDKNNTVEDAYAAAGKVMDDLLHVNQGTTAGKLTEEDRRTAFETHRLDYVAIQAARQFTKGKTLKKGVTEEKAVSRMLLGLSDQRKARARAIKKNPNSEEALVTDEEMVKKAITRYAADFFEGKVDLKILENELRSGKVDRVMQDAAFMYFHENVRDNENFAGREEFLKYHEGERKTNNAAGKVLDSIAASANLKTPDILEMKNRLNDRLYELRDKDMSEKEFEDPIVAGVMEDLFWGEKDGTKKSAALKKFSELRGNKDNAGKSTQELLKQVLAGDSRRLEKLGSSLAANTRNVKIADALKFAVKGDQQAETALVSMPESKRKSLVKQADAGFAREDALAKARAATIAGSNEAERSATVGSSSGSGDYYKSAVEGYLSGYLEEAYKDLGLDTTIIDSADKKEMAERNRNIGRFSRDALEDLKYANYVDLKVEALMKKDGKRDNKNIFEQLTAKATEKTGGKDPQGVDIFATRAFDIDHDGSVTEKEIRDSLKSFYETNKDKKRGAFIEALKDHTQNSGFHKIIEDGLKFKGPDGKIREMDAKETLAAYLGYLDKSDDRRKEGAENALVAHDAYTKDPSDAMTRSQRELTAVLNEIGNYLKAATTSGIKIN